MAGIGGWSNTGGCGETGGTGDLNERSVMGCQAKFAAETYVGKNKFSPFTVLEGFKDITARAIAIQLPIALASFLETIENVEAAELGGDSYNVHEAMLCDGLGTMFGAICGATIPTTVRRPRPPEQRTA